MPDPMKMEKLRQAAYEASPPQSYLLEINQHVRQDYCFLAIAPGWVAVICAANARPVVVTLHAGNT